MEFLSFPLFRRHRGEAQPSVRAVLDGERPKWFAHNFIKIITTFAHKSLWII